MRPLAEAILFDKDGTLFNFGDTWNDWGRAALQHYAQGDAGLLAALARETGFDLGTGRFGADSPVVACTNREVAECIARALPGQSVDEVESHLTLSAVDAPLVQTVPLAGFLADLRGQGLRLGVMTNDSEFTARAHLRAVGVEQAFDFIAGFDSGFGAKPSPAPLLAFSEALDIAPGRVVMVGDSPHDLDAGRAAGMMTVGVLTGPNDAATLAPLADVVLPDIGHLPLWLGLTPA